MDNIHDFTSLLNKYDQSEMSEFERALFEAFKNVADPSLDAIWDIDRSEQKIKIRIPYADQEIMILRINGLIAAAASVNFNMSSKLQLEEFGFKINKDEKNICEGLFIFNIHPDLSLAMAFKKRLIEYLILRNIKKFYGTCSEKRIKGYRLLGFNDIETRIFNGQKKYLLIANLENT
jgi:hypothetical protein